MRWPPAAKKKGDGDGVVKGCSGVEVEERVHQRSKNLVATKWNVFHSWNSPVKGGKGGWVCSILPPSTHICHLTPASQSFGHARKLLSLPQLDTETVPNCHCYPLDGYSEVNWGRLHTLKNIVYINLDPEKVYQTLKGNSAILYHSHLKIVEYLRFLKERRTGIHFVSRDYLISWHL